MRKEISVLVASFGMVLIGAMPAWAINPTLGGPMRHILITMPGTEIIIGFDHDSSETMQLADYCETYAAPAEMLDGMAYNGQYGWLANGFISLPIEYDIWIELVSQSDGLETYEANSFEPIFTTAQSPTRWRWSGAMTHNWYAVVEPGAYEATYRVYVGDDLGEPVAGYSPAEVTLDWAFGSTCLPGDVSCDDVVSLDDIPAFVELLMDASAGTAHERCAADVNKDGVIDGLDVQAFVAAM